jgi:hypothetical protein
MASGGANPRLCFRGNELFVYLPQPPRRLLLLRRLLLRCRPLALRLRKPELLLLLLLPLEGRAVAAEGSATAGMLRWVCV